MKLPTSVAADHYFLSEVFERKEEQKMRSIEHGLLRNNIVTLITREDGGRLET